MTPVLVALAGGVGAVLRFVVDGVVARRNGLRFPLGTVVINVTGSLLLGVLVGLSLRYSGLDQVKLVLGTGLLGGYTTFSTASVEAIRLATQVGPRPALLAALHAAGMLVVSLAAAGLGLWLAESL